MPCAPPVASAAAACHRSITARKRQKIVLDRGKVSGMFPLLSAVNDIEIPLS